MAQIALVEAEHVVVVVVLILLAIVVHGGVVHTQLIDGGGVDLGQNNAHVVIVDLLDTLNVGGRVTGLDTSLVLVAQGIDGQGVQIAAGRLNANSLVDIAVEVVQDGLPEVLDGGILSQLVTPVGSAGSHGVVSSVVAVGDAVVADLLGEGSAGLVVVVIPESVVLLFGVQIVGGIAIGAGSVDHVTAAVHTGTIGVHAQDGLSIQGAGAIIGRIAQDVHGEDHVVHGQGLTIGELQVIAQLEIIVHGAISILGDGQVGRAIVGIVRAIEVDGLTLDTLEDNGASTVAGQQTELGHSLSILVIGSLGEEGRELAVKRGITHNKRLSSTVATAGHESQRHDESEEKCKDSLSFFHLGSSLKRFFGMKFEKRTLLSVIHNKIGLRLIPHAPGAPLPCRYSTASG